MIERWATPPGGKHPRDAYVRPDGVRDLTMEHYVVPHDDTVVIHERHGNPIVTWHISPEGIEWLLEQLPDGDEAKKELEYARDLAKQVLWDRTARA